MLSFCPSRYLQSSGRFNSGGDILLAAFSFSLISFSGLYLRFLRDLLCRDYKEQTYVILFTRLVLECELKSIGLLWKKQLTFGIDDVMCYNL
jgi:hypothetical protein